MKKFLIVPLVGGLMSVGVANAAPVTDSLRHKAHHDIRYYCPYDRHMDESYAKAYREGVCGSNKLDFTSATDEAGMKREFRAGHEINHCYERVVWYNHASKRCIKVIKHL